MFFVDAVVLYALSMEMLHHSKAKIIPLIQLLVALAKLNKGSLRLVLSISCVKIQALALSMLCVKELRLNSSFYDWGNIFLMPGLDLPAVYVSGHG